MQYRFDIPSGMLLTSMVHKTATREHLPVVDEVTLMEAYMYGNMLLVLILCFEGPLVAHFAAKGSGAGGGEHWLMELSDGAHEMPSGPAHAETPSLEPPAHAVAPPTDNHALVDDMICALVYATLFVVIQLWFGYCAWRAYGRRRSTASERRVGDLKPDEKTARHKARDAWIRARQKSVEKRHASNWKRAPSPPQYGATEK